VRGVLANRKVLLVLGDQNVPGDTVKGVTALVEQAGGSVSGTIRLHPGYSDPAVASSLQGYVTGSGLPTGLQLPATDDAGQLVASVLAQVLMIPHDGRAGDGSRIASVLAGLNALDALNSESPSVTAADYAMVLTTGVLTGKDAADRNGTLTDLVSALDSTGSGAVVAGDPASAADNGLVGAVRNDPTLSAAISTVDNAATSAGQISTVLALAAESTGKSGNYGTGKDTQPVPPVPSATP
jgi:hypothetical protein